MKRPRSAALILSLLAIPYAALAAQGEARVVAVSGGATTSVANAEKAALKAGGTITQGTLLETGPGTNVYIELPNDGKLMIGPGARLRVSNFSTGESGTYTLELILTRGTLTGDATGAGSSSNFRVRTTGGVARLAGTTFQVGFSPAGATGGTFVVTSTAGIITVSPTGTITPVSVQAGNTLSLTSNGARTSTPQLSATTSTTAKQIVAILGEPAPAAAGAVPSGPTPAAGAGAAGAPTRFDPTTVISPNGEGAVL